MNFATKIVVVLIFICLCELSDARKGSKHRKHPEKSTASEVDEQNFANGSAAVPSSNAPTTKPTPQPVKDNLANKGPSRKHMEKRCCRIGYRAAKRRLYCMVDSYYSAKYTNMEHYTRQKFHSKKPSRATRRFMHHLDRYCIKPQLKGVFYKCCLDGILTARQKGTL